MAVLVADIALALGTTAQDWYAASRLTLVEALIGFGFDEFVPTEYHTEDGETLRLSRFGLTIGEAWAVRARTLSMAAGRVVLRASAGLAKAVLCLWRAKRCGLRGLLGSWVRAVSGATAARRRSDFRGCPRRRCKRWPLLTPRGSPTTVRTRLR